MNMAIALRARGLLIVLLALFLAGQPLAPSGASTGEPGQFLLDLKDDAVKQLANEDIAKEERQSNFRALLVEGFDVPAIGRFVLGKYWRRASEDERKNFIKVFVDVITLRFMPVFENFEDSITLTIDRVARDKDKPEVVDVFSTLSRPNGEPVKIAWRLLDRDGGYKIVDIRVEGVSLAVTLRSEYTSAIRNAHKGSVGSLVEDLQSKVESGEISAASFD